MRQSEKRRLKLQRRIRDYEATIEWLSKHVSYRPGSYRRPGSSKKG